MTVESIVMAAVVGAFIGHASWDMTKAMTLGVLRAAWFFFLAWRRKRILRGVDRKIRDMLGAARAND